MTALSRGNNEIIAEKHPRNDCNVQSLFAMKMEDFEYNDKLSKTRLAVVNHCSCRSLNPTFP